GHVSNGSLGRLYYESACYEFETRVAHAQFGNFPSGAVVEFDAHDIEATEERLMSVLDEVTLPDGRSGLWARKVPTEPVSSVPDAAGATPSGTEAVAPGQSAADVAIAEPAPDASVRSPLRVVGAVSGTWFFEASFPYQVLSVDGAVLASGAIVAESDWMTEALVPFEASIEFDVTSPTDALLVLARDNPSGLPENDASYEIPLHLLP
ncbi:MAG TPA: Gmad2 immunoglobulin-like domain-containing protein, partial [Trueperaceae bacterium]|nr:Gmad2 immunoglobulin-like domain-containing protein [Trueperaceae bacterium]